MTEPSRTPAFAPVPVRARKDGWTPERQDRFIAALHATRSVGAAARAAGMTRASAYRLRDRPGAGSFAAAWGAAVAPDPEASTDIRSASDDLWDRAMNGRVIPIIRKGVQVGHRVRPDNKALLTLMRRFDRSTRGIGEVW